MLHGVRRSCSGSVRIITCSTQIWLEGTGKPRILLKPCVVNIIAGLCNTAACRAVAGVAPVELPEHCRFGQAETGRHAAAMQVCAQGLFCCRSPTGD